MNVTTHPGDTFAAAGAVTPKGSPGRARGFNPWSAAAAALLLLVPACAPKAVTTADKAEPQATAVTVAEAKTVQLRRTVPAIGTLHAFDDVQLAPKVDGRVRGWFKNEGDVVFPGEVLLELDPTDYELAANQARLALLAESIVLNYMALHDDVGRFATALPSHGLGGDVNNLIAFAPIRPTPP